MKPLAVLITVLLFCTVINPWYVVAGGSLRGGLEQRPEQQQDNRTLIIGGEIAQPGDYPYFVHFSNPGCGGTLIAPNIVLTAAHVRNIPCKQTNT